MFSAGLATVAGLTTVAVALIAIALFGFNPPAMAAIGVVVLLVRLKSRDPFYPALVLLTACLGLALIGALEKSGWLVLPSVPSGHTGALYAATVSLVGVLIAAVTGRFVERLDAKVLEERTLAVTLERALRDRAESLELTLDTEVRAARSRHVGAVAAAIERLITENEALREQLSACAARLGEPTVDPGRLEQRLGDMMNVAEQSLELNRRLLALGRRPEEAVATSVASAIADALETLRLAAPEGRVDSTAVLQATDQLAASPAELYEYCVAIGLECLSWARLDGTLRVDVEAVDGSGLKVRLSLAARQRASSFRALVTSDEAESEFNPEEVYSLGEAIQGIRSCGGEVEVALEDDEQVVSMWIPVADPARDAKRRRHAA